MTSSSPSTPPPHQQARNTVTATTAHTSNNNNNTTKTHSPSQQQDASCRSCVQLVSEILQNPHSRPRQVLHAIMMGALTHDKTKNQQAQQQQEPSFELKAVTDGVQIQLRLPKVPTTLPRRWTHIVPHTLNDDNNNHKSSSSTSSGTFGTPVLATSAILPPKDPPVEYTTETIKIECRPCDSTGPEQGARALIMGPTPLSIVACTNRLTAGDKDEMSQVLVHELLHAYDVKRLHLDFADCESMAYSEVRAAREAECFSSPMLLPTFLKEYCVKQKAIAATHNLFPRQGRQCVRTVFGAAYHDPRPFHGHTTHPNNKNHRQHQHHQAAPPQQSTPTLQPEKPQVHHNNDHQHNNRHSPK